MAESGQRAGETRAVVYCLVPRDLARKLHEPLRRHFRDDPDVEVVVERRGRERRVPDDRRAGGGSDAPAGGERRRIRSARGRRVGERRASLVDLGCEDLPRAARPHAEHIALVERIEPTSEEAEDRDSARLVIAFQAGDPEAFAALYMRYFDRVYAYVRVALKDSHDAEDATQELFARAFQALPAYEVRSSPFRAWLFVSVRNYVRDVLKKQGRIEVMDPVELRDRSERNGPSTTELSALEWISDRELFLFIERLPLAQRQVVVLRYMLGLSTPQIAQVLDRSEPDVRMLQSRALKFLRERLASLGGRWQRPAPRTNLTRCRRPANVLRARRFALNR